MNRRLGQRAVVALAAAALATGASALFGGTAFAGSHGTHNNSGGAGGSGGDANANCLIPVGVTAGIVGQGGDNTQCNATGGGAGNGGTGANY
ncbi:MAG TPA: hypothetical protein VH008_33645 [Pseudonocardia sp.]|jgi:hypothetical protein|nr:hypothetical protein [Pseudonocardia sp.]